ncbi:MAG: FAD-dependent monooxygenase [Chloroflexi bacterium]|nr:FAD-dependent monooxygenase [Chloroflexota bacterium]
MELRHQVIIVGGGPVGVALAVELGLRGISCALVERHLTPQRIPKGQNLTQRTLEHFYFWGIADELRAARLLPAGYPIGGITAYGDLMSEYWYAPAGRESVRSYYFQDNDRLPQYLTEEVLRTRLADLPNVKCLFGWAADSIEQDDQGVRVTITEVGGSGKQVLEAEYVVGCDGARSTVRDQLGIERGGPDYDQLMVLAVFRSRELHEGLKRFPERTTYRVIHPDLKGVWRFFGRIDVGEGWFFHAPVPRDTTAENYDLHGLLQRAAGFSFSCTFDHIGFWDLRIAVANGYRQRRGFIVGDAAHSHPPYGAFGLNTGLEDVANLGWKLAAALEGWGGETLLDSYGEERRPVFWETGETMISDGIEADRAFLERYSPERDREEFELAWQQLQAAGGSRQRSYEPHYEGSSVVLGPPNSSPGVRGSHSYVARPGHHLAPQPLSSGRNVFEELGTGFTLLAFGAETQSIEALQQAAESLRVPLRVVQDSYEGERKAYESRLVLVRPDQYVVWAGDQLPSDAAGLIKKAAGIA